MALCSASADLPLLFALCLEEAHEVVIEITHKKLGHSHLQLAIINDSNVAWRRQGTDEFGAAIRAGRATSPVAKPFGSLFLIVGVRILRRSHSHARHNLRVSCLWHRLPQPYELNFEPPFIPVVE